MSKYKICKFVDGGGEEWYQIKKKGWLFWYYMWAYKGGAPEFSPPKSILTFYTIDQAKQYIERDIEYTKKNTIKKVECIDYV